MISLPTAVVTDNKSVMLSIRMLGRRDTAHLLDGSARGGCQVPESPCSFQCPPRYFVTAAQHHQMPGNGWDCPKALDWDRWTVGSYLLIAFAG